MSDIVERLEAIAHFLRKLSGMRVYEISTAQQVMTLEDDAKAIDAAIERLRSRPEPSDVEAMREALEEIKDEWEELIAETGGFDPNDQDAIKAEAALRFYSIACRALGQREEG